MKLVQEDVWTVVADQRVVTTNSTVTKHGKLVMGSGIAKEAMERYPHIPKIAGSIIKEFCGTEGIYGLLCVGPVWLFQTKQFWNERADLRLIRRGVDMLGWYARYAPSQIWALNYPGIGFGGLDDRDVLPIIQPLPDNVLVCHHGNINV